jgi:hypothetical protein
MLQNICNLVGKQLSAEAYELIQFVEVLRCS